MAAPTSSKKQKLLEAIEKNQKQLKLIEETERMKFAALAQKSGLFDVEFEDAEMIKALKEVAARFRAPVEKQKQTKAS